MPATDQDFVDRVIAEHAGRPGALLTILERVQERHPQKYLTAEVLEYIAQKTDIPLSQIHSVVTFYALFNLEAQGRATVCVCRGTACHTRGSRRLLDRLKLDLGLHGERGDESSEADKLSITTPDGKYTIRTVACFGQCALAPVVEIDHEIFGHMNERALRTEMDELEKESRKHAHSGHQHF
jgi:NADH-quinone oxidoreductase subunit E